MKILLAGGSGQIGHFLCQHFQEKHYELKILTRQASKKNPFVFWDAETLGPWQKELETCDVLINLSGHNINCRPNKKNLKKIKDSRIQSTLLLGEALSQCEKGPKLWIQMSTSGIYSHSLIQAHDEYSHSIGEKEKAPYTWKHHAELAIKWEEALFHFQTPLIRKVIIRSAFVISPRKKTYFDVLLNLVKMGMGGPIAGGNQYVSWIHFKDFIRAIDFLISCRDIEGIVHFSSPYPITQKELMSQLRLACRVKMFFPIPKWLSQIGAFFLQTDPNLVLKSSRILPQKLLDKNFQFQYPTWSKALEDMLKSR